MERLRKGRTQSAFKRDNGRNGIKAAYMSGGEQRLEMRDKTQLGPLTNPNILQAYNY